MAAEPFLTPSEVLVRLRVNVKTLYRLIADGDLPAVRIGRQWRVRPHDLETWLRNHQNGADPGPDHARGTPGDTPEGNQACHPHIEGVSLPEDRL
jgi:excisionase family DNA binding protein